MNKTEFKGRETELQLLNRLWDSPKATLLILYGRRRVGKTRLLTHWLEQRPGKTIYWVAQPASALEQLRSFSQTLYNFSHPDTPAPSEFTFASWEQAFQHVAAQTRDNRLALFIDEVTYLLEVDPTFGGTLQKIWDHTLSKSNLIFVLSGSQMGLMQRQMLSYEAPLYGRATAQIKLPPLPFSVTAEFFPTYTAMERVAVYAVFGGIPAYWERLDQEASVMENVRLQLLQSNVLMQDEPRILLQDFINDPHNYVGILRAIASGERTQNDIAKRSGLTQGHVSKYLSVLRDTGFVERQTPVTEAREASRRGQYFLTDPYLRFYYRFLYPHLTQLALGAQQETLRSISHHLPEFLEHNTWQELCREWVTHASSHGELPLLEEVGGAWVGNYQVAVAGINRMEQHLVLGECLWRDTPAELSELHDLIAKTQAILPKGNDWTVSYLGFTSKAWSERSLLLAEEMIRSMTDGKPWQVKGVRLLTLEDVDQDLLRWSVLQP